MFARVYSGGLLGVEAYRIEVEVDCGSGMGQIHIVGLPGAAVQESAERVRSAIKACEFAMTPGHKWVVNLAPGDMRKEGPIYDLPIAAGILASSQFISCDHLSNFWIVGELGLDGSVRPITGVLPLAFACKESGVGAIIVPEANVHEAALVDGLTVYPVNHLQQVCNILADPGSVQPALNETARSHCAPANDCADDYSEVIGQGRAKRALEIAAAGHHNILLVGPPGTGKSMLAQRLPGIMPPLEFCEALELTKLYSAAGKLRGACTLMVQRPFRTPHHTASEAGLVGGGSIPKPGEISLSHHGILFLDELTEFPRRHLDTLRQPLESGNITISRSRQTLSYPASFLFVGACNPCPCGYRGDSRCACSKIDRHRYWSRLSGPLLDRIDLQVPVKRLSEHEMATASPQESSKSIRSRVLRAVGIQKQRSGGSQLWYNGRLNTRQLHRFCAIDEPSRQELSKQINKLGLSARMFDRTLRVARTIADLGGRKQIGLQDLIEALTFRIQQDDSPDSVVKVDHG